MLVGHSIAGEELSWVGSVHPEKVAGLIYLDAALGFAWYTSSSTDWNVAMADLWRRLEMLRRGSTALDEKFAQDLLRSTTEFQDDLPPLMKELTQMPGGLPTPGPIQLAVMFGGEKFTAIHAPALAIFACPHSARSVPGIGTDHAALIRQDAANCTAQADSFQKGNPADTVVRVADGDHAVFQSNPNDVERAMLDFLRKKLKKGSS